jgi:hypothetical protein
MGDAAKKTAGEREVRCTACGYFVLSIMNISGRVTLKSPCKRHGCKARLLITVSDQSVDVKSMTVPAGA